MYVCMYVCMYVYIVTYLDCHRQVFSVRVIFILEVPEYLKNKI